MFGRVLVQSVPSHCSLLGGLLHLIRHELEVVPASSGHGQELCHAGSLQVVHLVERHMDTVQTVIIGIQGGLKNKYLLKVVRVIIIYMIIVSSQL